MRKGLVPNSASDRFYGISVVVNRSAAINNRFLFAYSFTPNPVQRLKSRRIRPGNIQPEFSQAWSRSQPNATLVAVNEVQ